MFNSPLKDKHEKILKKIASLRLEKGISFIDMAMKLGLTESGYFKVEKGKTKLDLKRLLLILMVLEITVADFFKDID